MATVLDIATALEAALVEIGIDGRLDVRADGSRSTSWIGLPTGNDVEVTVTVKPLERK